VQVVVSFVPISLHDALDTLVERCRCEWQAYSSTLVERQVFCRHRGSLVWIAREDRTVMRQIRSRPFESIDGLCYGKFRFRLGLVWCVEIEI
jgi:hypothetical protein